MAQQLKGVVMPYTETQRGEKAMLVTTKAKKFTCYGTLRRVGSVNFSQEVKDEVLSCIMKTFRLLSPCLEMPSKWEFFLFSHRNAPWHATGVSVPRRPRKPQKMLLLLAKSKMYHYSKPREEKMYFYYPCYVLVCLPTGQKLCSFWVITDFHQTPTHPNFQCQRPLI